MRPIPPMAATDAIRLSGFQRWQAGRVLAGECSVGLMGDEAATAAAWVIRNRILRHGFSPGLAKFNGRAKPTDQELAIVDAVMAAEDRDDPTGGAQWIMSRQDVVRLGFREGDLIFEAPGDARFQVHVYQRSPFVRGE